MSSHLQPPPSSSEELRHGAERLQILARLPKNLLFGGFQLPSFSHHGYFAVQRRWTIESRQQSSMKLLLARRTKLAAFISADDQKDEENGFCILIFLD